MKGVMEEARMTAQAVTDFLAQVREGTRVTVRYGGGENGAFALYSERVTLRMSRNGTQRVELSSGCILQKDGAEWFLTEKGKGRKRVFPLLTIQSA